MPKRRSKLKRLAPRGALAARFAGVVAALLAGGVGGCQATGPDAGLVRLVQEGRYGQARAAAGVWAEENPKSRRWLLDRERELVLALADGAPSAVLFDADYVYDMLREQGVNRGKAIGTVLWGESAVRIWKGEPFEQAMAYHYIGVLDGLLGDWGNVRATARNSLFLLRDFSKVVPAGASEVEARTKVAQSLPDEASDDPTPTVESDFELGYLMQGVGSLALGDAEEAREALAKLVRLAPRLEPLARRVLAQDYDLVLVVDYGLGPEKYAGGPNNVLALYRPRTPSTGDELVVQVRGREPERFPVVTDLNRLAQDVKWNNLEDLRRAKSNIGTALAFGGGAVALASDDDTAQLAGLGAMLAGLALQATSGADTTQLEVLPQRVYVALLDLPDEPTEITLQVDRHPASRLVLPHVPPPQRRPALQYVRLVDALGPYATAGRLLWANDAVNPLSTPSLPYILGGRDVRTPTAAAMEDYHAAGLPRSVSLSDLLEIYRDEGIWIEQISTEGHFGRHILEGGNALYTPEPMSPSFVRLFAQEHPPYEPRGERLRELRARLAESAASVAER